MAVPRTAYSRNLKKLYDYLAGLMKMKVATKSITANTVLASDDTVGFPMAANQKYRFRAKIFFDTNATANFKWRHTGPASPTLVRIQKSTLIPGATASSNIGCDTAYSAADNAETGAGTTGGVLTVEGVIHNGPNAGSFAIQWAQNTSNAGATAVLAGSHMEYSLVS